MANLDFILPDGDFAQQLESQIVPVLNELEEKLPLTTADGARLACRIYPTANAKAVVCICHGFSEFAEKYQEIIYYFIQAGYAVAICDHRGHGYSTRLVPNLCKVHIDNFDTYVTDFNILVEYASQRFSGLPMLLFGHSMGGCISALYLQEHTNRFKGAVLSAPMMELNSGVAPTYGWLYARHLVKSGHATDYVLPDQGDFDGIRRFEGSSCADESRFNVWFDKRLAEPRYQTNNATASWLMCGLQAQSRAVLRAGKIKTPILLCQAGQDHLVLPKGHERFVKRAKNAKLVKFANARHEIFNSGEGIRRKYWGRVLDFYEQILG